MKNPGLVPRQLVPQQQTVDYFQAVQGPLRAINDGVLGKSASSLGQVVMNTTPIVVASRMMKKRGSQIPLGGIGGSDGFLAGASMGTLAVVAFTYVAVTGALSYQAAKAMAPNRSDQKIWGWIGVPVGLFSGAWGLGVMGVVSNSKR